MKIHPAVYFVASATVIVLWATYVFVDVSPARHERGARSVLSHGRMNASIQENDRCATPESVAGMARQSYAKHTHPELKEQLDDKVLLDEVVNELMKHLSTAVAAHDTRRIFDLVEKLRKIGYGARTNNGLPMASVLAVKRAILDAVAPLGIDGVGVTLDFLNDADPQVAQLARDNVLYSARDLRNGDYVCAEIVIAAASEMSDAADLDVLFRQLGRMRNSVAAEVLRQVAASGTAAAQARIPAEISQFTRDGSVSSLSALAEWLETHPDRDDADRVNGPKRIVVAR